jgi:hypothetical protein
MDGSSRPFHRGQILASTPVAPSFYFSTLPMSSSVLRQYTPPTCTLEIAAKESPLSRWTDRSVLKHLRFQLRFDDPRLLAEQQVQVTGDRLQLDALADAVDAYVQTLLDAAPVQLGHAFDQQAPTTHANGTGRVPSASATQDGETVPVSSSSTALSLRQQEPLLAYPHGVFLEPRGLLSHILHLGTLAPSDERETVSLSTLQLFDLANALDDYKADALALPTLNRPAWAQSRRGWLQVAAIALVAIGVTSVVGKFVMDVNTPSMQTATTQESTENDQTVSLAPSETAPTAIPSAEPFPAITPLPPPPPLGTTKQPTTPLPPVGVPRTVTPRTNPPPAATQIPPLPPLSSIPRQAAPSARANQGQSELRIPSQSASPNVAAAPPSARAGGSARGSGDNLSLEANPQLGTTADQAQPAPSSPPSGASANAIPQVAEVRQYFQETWQPPEALDRSVEYRLLVGADGTIQQIVPLGAAAGDYVDRTGMPLVGDPFVSPIESGKRALIRLVLNPDGTVQTFLEAVE